MKADPAIRKDGRCARSGCSKLRPIVEATGKKLRELERYAGQQAHADPFCSSRCCRIYHDAVINREELDDELSEQRAAAGKRGADRFRAAKAAAA